MLLDEYIEITVRANTASHYKKMGYDIPTKIDNRGRTVVALGEKIMVKQCDLPPTSKIKVKVICDYCGELYETAYGNYISGRKKEVKKDACKRCKVNKSSDTLLLKYGESNPMKIDEVKERAVNTCLNKYGCRYVTMNDEVKKKIKNTMISKYGVENISQLENVINKRKKTNLARYGSETPCGNADIMNKVKSTNLLKYGCVSSLQNVEVNRKARITCMEKYGCEYPAQSLEIKEKMNKTLYRNQTAPSSRQQNYIHSIYGGELNYPIQRFCVDICVLEDKMAIEYSGSGHWLSIQYGTVTKDEFKRKEVIRSSYIKKAGFFLLTIESKKDYLPSDEILLKIYEESRIYFNTTSHTWRIYHIDDGIFRDAEHLDGEWYDFGKLRKIKKSA